MEDLGVSREQFAELALSGPLDWDAEQMDNLQALLEGDPVDPELLFELVEDFLHHTPGTRDKVRDTRDITPREMLDPEELAEELAGTQDAGIPLQFQPPPELEVPSASVNLDDWLKKKG